MLNSLPQVTFQVTIKSYAEVLDMFMFIIDYLHCLPDVCK